MPAQTSSANFKRARFEFAGAAELAAHPRGGKGGCARFEFNPKRKR